MKRLVLALVAASAFPGSALAMQEPIPSPKDSRIRVAAFADNDVIHITSTALNPVQIVLQDGEQVASFAGLRVRTASKPDEMKNVHDWFIRWSGNSIFLQPLKAEKSSLLFVDTKAPDDKMRHYRFQIDTRDPTPGVDAGEYEAVNMTYPAYIAAQKRAAWLAGAADRARAAAAREMKAQAAEAEWRLKQAQIPFAVGRNWRYEAQNINADDQSCEIIGPEHAAGISDDGQSTRLLFSPHSTLPAPYVLDQDGKESLVQHSQEETADGLVMTLHMVVPKIILRRGDRVCALINRNYDPIGHQPGTGTITRNVIREVRQ